MVELQYLDVALILLALATDSKHWRVGVPSEVVPLVVVNRRSHHPFSGGGIKDLETVLLLKLIVAECGQ